MGKPQPEHPWVPGELRPLKSSKAMKANQENEGFTKFPCKKPPSVAAPMGSRAWPAPRAAFGHHVLMPALFGQPQSNPALCSAGCKAYIDTIILKPPFISLLELHHKSHSAPVSPPCSPAGFHCRALPCLGVLSVSMAREGEGCVSSCLSWADHYV